MRSGDRRGGGKLPAHMVAYLTMRLCLFGKNDYEEVDEHQALPQALRHPRRMNNQGGQGCLSRVSTKVDMVIFDQEDDY